jgi:hypothetical protein
MFKSLRTTDDDGRKRIAIGHLSDSGDLKQVNKDALLVLTGIPTGTSHLIDYAGVIINL